MYQFVLGNPVNIVDKYGNSGEKPSKEQEANEIKRIKKIVPRRKRIIAS